MNVKKVSKIKNLPWPVVIDGMNKLGHWTLFQSTMRTKSFTRRNEKIVAVKLGPNRWKAEYFVNGRLHDTSGMAEEEFVKRIILQMAVYV